MGTRTYDLIPVTVTELDKVMFPESGITKGDVIHYYERIATTMLPHLRGRPVVVERFKRGIGETGRLAFDAPDGAPDWLPTVTLPAKDEIHVFPTCEGTASLIAILEDDGVALYCWPSRRDRPKRPDRLRFALEPRHRDVDFGAVRDAAQRVREVLAEVGLASFVMTDGDIALHLVCPLDRGANFATVSNFAHDTARLITMRHPEAIGVPNPPVPDDDDEAARPPEPDVVIRVDGNRYGQHWPAPYSLRAFSGAPVATPLDWHEVSAELDSARRYTIKNVGLRLGQKDDPWRAIETVARSVREPMTQVAALLAAR